MYTQSHISINLRGTIAFRKSTSNLDFNRFHDFPSAPGLQGTPGLAGSIHDFAQPPSPDFKRLKQIELRSAPMIPRLKIHESRTTVPGILMIEA